MEWLIDLLKWLVPTIVAIIGVVFGIMQRKTAKEELSKKRRLENALTNLNDIIKVIEELPSIIEFDRESDVISDLENVVVEILTASLNTKKKIINLKISYDVEDFGDPKIPFDKRYPFKKISVPKEYDPNWLLDVLKDKGIARIHLRTQTKIKGYTRLWANSPDPNDFLWVLHHLLESMNKLSLYEEVYETLADRSLDEVEQISEQIGKTLFELIYQGKKYVKIDLNKLDHSEKIEEYLMEQILNYSELKKQVLKASMIASSLKKARKELFLRLA